MPGGAARPPPGSNAEGIPMSMKLDEARRAELAETAKVSLQQADDVIRKHARRCAFTACSVCEAAHQVVRDLLGPDELQRRLSSALTAAALEGVAE